MGYYTYYSLTGHSNDRDVAERVRDALFGRGLIGYVFEDDPIFFAEYKTDEEIFYFSPCDAAKWYDCEEDMLLLSRQFPDVRFTVSGEGEENRDIWEEHFLNGKCQYCPAEIVIPEYDPAKLVTRYYPEREIGDGQDGS